MGNLRILLLIAAAVLQLLSFNAYCAAQSIIQDIFIAGRKSLGPWVRPTVSVEGKVLYLRQPLSSAVVIWAEILPVPAVSAIQNPEIRRVRGVSTLSNTAILEIREYPQYRTPKC